MSNRKMIKRMRFDGNEVHPCSACCASKRKCDMKYPTCTRCEKNAIICMYKKSSNVTKEVAAIEKNMELSVYGLEKEFGTLISDLIMEDSFRISSPMTYIDDIFNLSGMATIPSYNSALVPSPSAVGATSPMLRHFHVATHPAPSDKDQTLFIDRVRQYPKMFLRKLSTPFIHPRLYPNGMPPVLGKALAMCSLYYSINESNFTESYAAINQLIGQFTDQTSSIYDKLAAAQALVLAQSIRLFGGVIRQQSLGEKDCLRLLMLLDSLLDYVNDHPGVPTSFQYWVLLESIVRTFFLGCLSQSLYWCQRGDKVYEPLHCKDMRMMGSKAFWEGATEHNFEEMLEQYRDYYVSANEALRIISRRKDGRNLDFECLMLLASMNSVDFVNRNFNINLHTRPEFLEFL